jgi:hypothetical protein
LRAIGDKLYVRLSAKAPLALVSRIETTGQRNKIHISDATAKLLITAGKGHWVKGREDTVVAKGKGELVTHWLELTNDGSKSTSSRSTTESGSSCEVESGAVSVAPSIEAFSDKETRLVEWIHQILQDFLKVIAVRRQAVGVKPDPAAMLHELEQEIVCRDAPVLDEVEEIITLPKFNRAASHTTGEVGLSEEAVAQLRQYIQGIAAMYKNNPFHNFEVSLLFAHCLFATNGLNTLLTANIKYVCHS